MLRYPRQKRIAIKRKHDVVLVKIRETLPPQILYSFPKIPIMANFDINCNLNNAKALVAICFLTNGATIVDLCLN